MMNIPMKVDYGIRALVDIASHQEHGPIRASEISKRQNIPHNYLEQVLHALGQKGITHSHRGPTGGHSLATDASNISMGQIMQCLGGNPSPMNCLIDISSCTQSSGCSQRNIWQEVEETIRRVLDDTSIADLVETTRRQTMINFPRN